MAFNKERIRAMMANVGKKGNPGFWNPPKDGETATIRMLPYPHADDPFVDFWFHFNIGKESILCPKQNGKAKTCSLCDLAAELYNSPNEQDKEISKRIFAKQRYYGIVVDRADPTLTPKYWGFSQTLYLKFLGWLGDPENTEREDFLDPEAGLDLKVKVAQIAGKSFKQADADTVLKFTKLAPTAAKIKEIISQVKPADKVFEFLSAEQIQSKIDAWMNAGSDPSAEPEVAKGGKPEQTADEKDIDAVFNEAFPA